MVIDNPEAEEQASDAVQEEVLFDLLTGETRKATPKEKAVQRMAEALAQEYHFPLETIVRDVPAYSEGAGQDEASRSHDATLLCVNSTRRLLCKLLQLGPPRIFARASRSL
jgi:hypothetical protein